jgi:hypothetical protein
MRGLLIAFLLLCLVGVDGYADGPKLAPVPSTEIQGALIREGVALHEKGDYDGAIKKYEEVLRENPSNIAAIYELSYTFEAEKDYQKSLETARRGAQYKSDLLDQFYLLIANDLDDMGQPDRAIAAYREGIDLQPGNFLLHYNLALAYDRQQKWNEARKSVKTAAMLNPRHASSHLLLAFEFSRANFRIPSLFAAARFLLLEANSARSDRALDILQRALQAGVTPGNKPNSIVISVDPSASKEEGDFGPIDLFLSMSRATGSMEKNENKSQIELEVEEWKSFLDLLTETESKKPHSEFVFKYYVPYFVELDKRGFVEPFVYYILQTSHIGGVTQWLGANQTRVDELLTWSNQYQWPKPK